MVTVEDVALNKSGGWFGVTITNYFCGARQARDLAGSDPNYPLLSASALA
jgi:hypothetical protein